MASLCSRGRVRVRVRARVRVMVRVRVRVRGPDAQLVLEVDVGRSEESVDAAELRVPYLGATGEMHGRCREIQGR